MEGRIILGEPEVNQRHRKFEFWLYRVRGRRLLLRAPGKGGGETQIDLLFNNVRWINIPGRMNGVSVVEVSGRELSILEHASGVRIAGDLRGYRIFGSNYEGSLIAANYEIDEGPYLYNET